MPRRHVVITGTGRSGTTFLVELLTHLGLDTGFGVEELDARKDKIARAGLEHDIRKDDAPYVVKSPSFCDYAAEVVDRDDIVIEHVFVPMRDLEAAAESRRQVARDYLAGLPVHKRLRAAIAGSRKYPGGLWLTRRGGAGAQEAVLLTQFHKLLLVLSGTRVPVTLMRYPRIVSDSQYLFDKLKPVLGTVSHEAFQTAYDRTARPDLVNTYGVRGD